MITENKVVESNKTVESKRILTVRVHRCGKEGLTVYVQSIIDWSTFKDDNGEYFDLGGQKCSFPKNNKLDNVPGQFRMESIWEFDDCPNLSIFLARDLEQGVTFKFGFVAVSDEKIFSWIANLKQQAKILYLTYLKPVDVEVNISTQTVEKQKHD